MRRTRVAYSRFSIARLCAAHSSSRQGSEMKIRTIVGLVVILSTWVTTVNAAQRPAATCDRECLRGTVTQLLYALVKHDVSGLPVADTLRVDRKSTRLNSSHSQI